MTTVLGLRGSMVWPCARYIEKHCAATKLSITTIDNAWPRRRIVRRRAAGLMHKRRLVMSEGLQPEQSPQQPPLPLQIESSPDDRTMALICHLVGGILGFLIPLIVWLI